MADDLSFTEVRNALVAALERASDTLKRLPMPRDGMPAVERSAWPLLPDNPVDAGGVGTPRVSRIPPRASAISDLDRILPWLVTLDVGDRRLVWARAAGLSWPRLAREFGISVGRIRYRWNNAIDRVVAAAVHDTLVTGTADGLHRRPCKTTRLAR